MECPKCTARMGLIEFEGVEVDRCTQCNGLFFDHLERELLKKLEGADSIDIGDEFMGAKYDEVRNIDCPRCNVTMDEVRENEPFEIRFESCPKCRGAFFDAGEFRDYLEDEILTQFQAIVDKLN